MDGIVTARTRLVGDYVFTGTTTSEGTADEAGGLLAGGAVDIAADGRILGVGAPADLAAATPDGAEITLRNVGGLLMPGLINTHAHTPMTLVRSAGDGMALQQWLTDAIWPREGNMSPDDAHWGMKLGSLEMLLAGVTTSCEMYFFEDAMVEAVEQTGGRLVLCPGVIAALLPDGDVEPRIAELAGLHARHHNPDGRVTVGYGPHSTYDLTPDQVGRIAAQAREVDALLHIHLEETQSERQQVIDTYGRSATTMLAEADVFAGPVIAAHGVWLDDDDQQILADAGAAVAHCPMSNLKLGSGIAPITAMRQRGLSVVLGTDGVASNDNLDLWEELKLAPLLARGVTGETSALSAVDALQMATVDAGKAVQLPDVGELKPGSWADIIRIDLDQPNFVPGLAQDLLTHVVFAGSSAHVTDVWVAGEQVVADRSPTKADLADTINEARTRGTRLAEAVR